jgi:hypothetical protein
MYIDTPMSHRHPDVTSTPQCHIERSRDAVCLVIFCFIQVCKFTQTLKLLSERGLDYARPDEVFVLVETPMSHRHPNVTSTPQCHIERSRDAVCFGTFCFIQVCIFTQTLKLLSERGLDYARPDEVFVLVETSLSHRA